MRNTKLAIIFIAGMLLVPGLAHAQSIIEESRVPGGVAVVEIPGQQQSPPRVSYLGNPVMVRQQSGHWYAVVGLGLKTKPGKKLLKVTQDKKEQIAFNVVDKHYPTQYVNGVPQKTVDLSPEDYKRYLKERKKINIAKKSWGEIDPASLQLMLPVKSRISGLFGRRRVFNGEPRNPHSGLDLAAPRGTHVYAPADGKVLLTGNFLFIGNAIFIDHGQGLITLYGHLSKIDVKTGDKVQRGHRIAEVGSTGRATGPHLHWGVYLNRVAVDPLLFINRNTADELIAGKTVKPERFSASSENYRDLTRSRS
ncbi:MAG: peptidoglycan DD-metalloendopeptidase family protein [Acidiferrobacterales bacterium]|jgi:murein DD-endopeptidase MepM/ murein hydrolase activator NlpD|nr:peptidoglycan DD-metalloendopeptidase family protein [Acidiferrobacterales bacterium]